MKKDYKKSPARGKPYNINKLNDREKEEKFIETYE
jgi:hypothetical protein